MSERTRKAREVSALVLASLSIILGILTVLSEQQGPENRDFQVYRDTDGTEVIVNRMPDAAGPGFMYDYQLGPDAPLRFPYGNQARITRAQNQIEAPFSGTASYLG